MSIVAKAPLFQDCHIANIRDTQWSGRYMHQTGRCTINWIGSWDWDTPGWKYAGLYAYQARTLQKFSLPKLPAGAQIKSAKLKMSMWKSETMHEWNQPYYAYNQNPTIEVRKLLEDWDEGLGDGLGHGYQYSGATWTTRKLYGYGWTQAGGYFDATPSATKTQAWDNSSWEFDITDLVKFWYQNPTKNFGLLLKYQNDQNAEGGMYMAGGELGWQDDYAPHIEIEYVGAPNPPRGLSPNYYSIVAPQISNSMKLKWMFDSNDPLDSQQYARVIVKDLDAASATVYDRTYGDMTTPYSMSEVPVSDFSASLVANHKYSWSVEAFNGNGLSSGITTAYFKYTTLPTYQAKPQWSPLPSANNNVKISHFTEIRDVLKIEASKYDGVNPSLLDVMFKDIDSIFGRKDFKTFCTTVDLMQSADIGNALRTDAIDGITVTSLEKLMKTARAVMKGAPKASDIAWIRSLVDSLATSKPTKPDAPTYALTTGSLGKPPSLTTTHSEGTYSRRISVSWPGAVVSPQTVTAVMNPSPSKDIAYYRLTYTQVAESGKSYASTIYFDSASWIKPL